ncbi:MAG: PilZ domain-containing protein [Desulfarculales bacterium]|nr:PilZ domain-containing protein [Desulfarculales bacterium]
MALTNKEIIVDHNDYLRNSESGVKQPVPPSKGNKVTAELHKSISTIYEVEGSLAIGETVLMQGKLRDNPVKAVLAGWIASECVLLSPPLSILAAGQFVKDEFLLIRYLFLGKVFGFETIVRKMVLDPPMVIVSWPDQVEVASISREIRLRARLEVLIILYNETKQEVPVKGLLIEISKGGCRIKISWNNDYMEYCIPGSLLELHLGLYHDKNPLKVSCIVRNFSKQGGYANMGLQFDNNSEKFKEELDYILNVQLIRT